MRELVDEVLRLNTHYATLLQLLVDTGCVAVFCFLRARLIPRPSGFALSCVRPML